MINLVRYKNLRFIKKAQHWLSLFVLVAFFVSCKKQNEITTITGNTMGTTYSIKIIDNLPQHIDKNNIKIKVDSVLRDVNQQMSTYMANSEISGFNRLNNSDWFAVSNDFYDVISMAQEISRLTNGAFDITVGPIINLWGFSGNLTQNVWQPPSEQDLKEVRKSIGFNNIAIGNNSIKKINPDTQIDLNAIAKGYGVDVVFDLLLNMHYADILVEIGGEVRCSGINQDGDSWRIGIDKPILDNMPGEELQSIILLDNKALATSGDYRNYFEYNGELYSHIINPLTGYPTVNNVTSASVTAPNCMTADAMATALMVMGKDGIELINWMEDIEATIVIRNSDNKFINFESLGWKMK